MLSFCVTYCDNIILQMHAYQMNRPLQYSSMVLGSRNTAVVAFPFKRTASIINTRGYPKKTDCGPSKCKNNKKMNNQRPDIFLEGLQLAKVEQVYMREFDFRSSQRIQQKIRNSTPCNFQKLQALALPLPFNLELNSRLNQSKTELDQQPKFSKPSQFKGFDKQNNLLKKEQITRITTSDKKETHYKINQRVYRTDRQRTYYQGNCLQKQVKQRIDQRLTQKSDEGQQVQKVEQLKRKQLFYVSQRDLTNIRSQSFIVVQHPSGRIITGYYYKKILEIASLTKIMTFYGVIYLISKFQLDPDHIIIKIDDCSAEMSGTSAELYEGDHYTVRQLLYALMLPSGNDAAVALARWGGRLLGEGPRQFILLMNRLASQLGMKSSTFGNPHGLPHPQNGSTAQDLSLLVAKCLQYDLFREVIKCKQFKCWTENEGIKRDVLWENTNKLLRRPGFSGVKTGVTVVAGPCLATLYSIKNREFIIILLRTNKLSRRFKQTRWILAMCLKKLNYDGNLSPALRELCREDPELDSDNSEEEQCFDFERNDHYEFQRRRKILCNQL